MNGKQLKNSILQLAIQGKLVPQNSADEPASELLKRIRKEKEQLVKDGKLKKKDLVVEPISDEEKPFEIPESWEWCRIGEVFLHASGKQLAGGKDKGTPREYITTSNLYWNRFVLDTLKVMCFTDEEVTSSSATKGDLLVCEGGAGYGRSAIWPYDYDICLQNHVHRLRPLAKNLSKYVYYIMYLLKESNQLDSVGTAMPGLSAGKLKLIPIPLPPLSEQHRIVAKIEELMPLVEEYDKAQTKLDDLNTKLPEALKKSILQEAIQGKLVDQDANDEPVSVLLQCISNEKEQLVKDGKLKKKDLVSEPITDEEKPFDIPDSWCWLRLGELVSNRAGLAYNKGDLDKKSDSMIRVLRGGNIYYGQWTTDVNDIMISSEFVNKELFLRKGTFITPAVTSLENMGKTALIEHDLDDTVVGGFVLMLQAYYKNESLLHYLLCFFNTAHYKECCKSITNKSGQAFYNISRKKMMDILVPIPPIEEQKRIVDKIDKLLGELK